jgi:hypothetical protein
LRIPELCPAAAFERKPYYVNPDMPYYPNNGPQFFKTIILNQYFFQGKGYFMQGV